MRAVNLIPSEQRPGAGGTYGRSGGVAYAVVGLACGLVAMSVLWLMARRDVKTRDAQVAQLSTQATTAQNEASSLAAYSSFVAMSNSRVANVEQLAQDRFDWAHAFHELGRVLPFDVSLTSVIGSISASSSTTPAAPSTSGTAASSAPASTSATPAGSVPSFAITGCTTSQSQVAYTMQRLALMDGVTNVTLGSSTGQTTSSGSSPAPSASGGAGACPFTFSITVAFTALPTVSPTAATGAAPTPTGGTLSSAGAGTTAATAATASGASTPAASTATAATPSTAGAPQ